MIVIVGGGGGRATPLAAAPGAVPTFWLVCVTDALTHLKNWLNASGLMSFITNTVSVTCLSTLALPCSPHATAMRLPTRRRLNSSAAACHSSVGEPSVSRK